MRKKSYFITILLCLVTLLFATEFTFAGNVGRAVYGIFTENYNGVHFDAPASDEDSVGMDKMRNMECYSKSNTKTDVALEGTNWWQFKVYDTWEGWAAIAIQATNTGSTKDMSEYYGGKIKFLARTTDSDMGYFKVGIKLKDSNGTQYEIAKAMNEFSGFVADGKWHEYTFDLSTDTNVNLTQTNLERTMYLFLFLGGDLTKTLNKTIDIDYIRWFKSGEGSFNVTVKNRSDNQVATDEIITWSQSAYRQSWTAAEQYIELDLDQESSNWYVKVYLDNDKATRKGLYCIDSDESEIVLPMAWRVRPDLLPNDDGDTLLIGRTNYGSYGLYDIGKNPGGTDWYTWSFMREKKAGIDDEDTNVWNLIGLHTVVWDHSSWDPLTNYTDRKPKIYFAADCSNAIGGLTYTANVVTELFYE